MGVHGIILFAHGSRDPLWRQPIDTVAARIRQLEPHVQVRCAYLELMEPDLPASATELAAAGVRSITVVPMFFGVGKHVREDLPGLMTGLRTSHPQVEFTLQSTLGEQAGLIELIAKIALSR